MEHQPWDVVSKMLVDGIVSERISIVDAYSFLVTNHPFSQYNNNTFWKRVFDRMPTQFQTVEQVQAKLFGKKPYNETVNWFRYLLAVNSYDDYFRFDESYRGPRGLGPPVGPYEKNSEVSIVKGTQRQIINVYIERSGMKTRVELHWQGVKNQDFADLRLLAVDYRKTIRMDRGALAAARYANPTTINFSGWGRTQGTQLLYKIMELGWYIEHRSSGRYLKSSIAFNEAPLSIRSLSFTPSFVTKY